ncbi:MAG: GNAT family N-acetyltransferase [Bacteroidota bacterium]|jgi:L-amino acid N-acyltransferase YncA
MIQIRPAVAADASRIASIYNDAILNGTATFDTEEKSESDRIQWLSEHVADNLPVLVSLQDGVVTGFAALNKWSPRKAYDTTAEVSLYMDAAYRGSGTGKLLFEQIVLAAQSVGLHCLVGRITQGNTVSIALSEQLGFSHIGIMREAGKKFGKFLDVHLMQKII